MTAPLSGLRRQPILIALAAIVFVLLAPIQARAAFQVSAVASATYTTGVLSPASSPTATGGTAVCGILTQGTIQVTWTATPSTYATGYVITPVLNGTVQTVVNVSGRTNTSASVSVQRGVGTSNSYVFRVQAVFNNWTSTTVTSNSASCPLLIGGL